MKEVLISLLIPALVSLFVAYFTIKWSIKKEIIWIKYDYNKFFIQERLKYYTELFKITQEIGKQNKGVEENLQIIKEAKEKFLAWRGTPWFVLLSKKSFNAFNILKENLKSNPWDGKKWYTKEQMSKIWKSRNALRWALKDDLGIEIENYIENYVD